ncbi:MAG: hypothetical protein KCHDKBKB_01956 [Elusimicrobia bacterium]|nr:hypothetical protein [Elusimicrobiota bacterium]
MRITIGGLLLFSGAAGFVLLGPLKFLDPSSFKNQLEGLTSTTEWVVERIKALQSGDALEKSSAEADKTDIPPVPAENNSVAAEVPAQAPPPVTDTVPAPVTAVQPKPQATPAVVTPKKSAVRKRRVKKKAVSPAAKTAPVTAPPKVVNNKDGLIGTYVALKLKSGREVKGIMQARSASQITIEIPGMGPFQYPAENVVTITPVE